MNQSLKYLVISILMFMAMTAALIQLFQGIEYQNLRAMDVLVAAANVLIFIVVTMEWYRLLS